MYVYINSELVFAMQWLVVTSDHQNQNMQQAYFSLEKEKAKSLGRAWTTEYSILE